MVRFLSLFLVLSLGAVSGVAGEDSSVWGVNEKYREVDSPQDFPKESVSQAEFGDGYELELTPEQYEHLLALEPDLKEGLEDLLDEISSLSLQKQKERILARFDSLDVGKRQARARSDEFLFFTLNRGKRLAEILGEETQGNRNQLGILDNQVLILQESIRFALKYYRKHLDRVRSQKGGDRVELQYARFGYEYVQFLIELNYSILDASAQYRIASNALGLFHVDLARGKDVENHASAIRTLYHFRLSEKEQGLIGEKRKNKTDAQFVQAMRELNRVYFRSLKRVSYVLGPGNQAPPLIVKSPSQARAFRLMYQDCTLVNARKLKCEVYEESPIDTELERTFLFDSDVVAIEKGTVGLCALLENRKAHCVNAVWGGYLEQESILKIDMGGVSPICALDSGGGVSCYDSLGKRTEIKPYGIRDIAVGHDFICTLDFNGDVSCQGTSEDGEERNPIGGFLEKDLREATAIYAENNSLCIQYGKRKLRCGWAHLDGDDWVQEDAREYRQNAEILQVEISDSANAGEFCVRTKKDQVFCWNNGEPSFSRENVIHLDSGHEGYLLLTKSGEVLDSYSGLKPHAVDQSGQVTGVSAGYYGFCMTDEDGPTRCHGRNFFE